ncbi:hypothetical protein Enr8_21520 [Blastopirellula retiformator]|uniref:Uncharacterized protein n=1 Tax=Blastopirellula retiformator TaxID=2527970 RepID=A0A5C5V864_9BACT|nr:hypothetical protein Enr8_21520 [Blastopirellula retiformator]
MESRLRGEPLIAQHKSRASRSLYDAISEVDSAKGKDRARDYLQRRPFPHFEAAVGQPGLVYKVDEDGTRTLGRFVNRQFFAADKL